MYFGRLENTETAQKKILPNEWMEEFTKTLNEVYHEKLEKNSRFFEVYGEIYDSEFVVIISYLHLSEILTSPITLFISHENQENSKKFKATLKNLINLAGVIFDDVFSTEDWNDYNLVWTENNYQGSEFYYKLTRENISLSLQAEALLNKEIEL